MSTLDHPLRRMPARFVALALIAAIAAAALTAALLGSAGSTGGSHPVSAQPTVHQKFDLSGPRQGRHVRGQ